MKGLGPNSKNIRTLYLKSLQLMHIQGVARYICLCVSVWKSSGLEIVSDGQKV